jgi:hypothetical protein
MILLTWAGLGVLVESLWTLFQSCFHLISSFFYFVYYQVKLWALWEWWEYFSDNYCIILSCDCTKNNNWLAFLVRLIWNTLVQGLNEEFRCKKQTTATFLQFSVNQVYFMCFHNKTYQCEIGCVWVNETKLKEGQNYRNLFLSKECFLVTFSLFCCKDRQIQLKMCKSKLIEKRMTKIF